MDNFSVDILGTAVTMHRKRKSFTYVFDLVPTKLTREVMYFATSSEDGNILFPISLPKRTLCVEICVQLQIAKLVFEGQSSPL